MKLRVGFGFDVHPLAKGHDFWLGGIQVSAEKGAVGHSDADVLIHAICDALLGAANLGDIGIHFSNSDPRWKGKDSKYFLKEVTGMIAEKGWRVENVDCTLCLEEPKIKPYISRMQEALAPLMNIPVEDVSIKATTNEKLGYVGRQDGVNAYAVALISKSQGA
jgi:2-C-methyl-D-erythritol 2,4-cyclodiphosphate synthase